MVFSTALIGDPTMHPTLQKHSVISWDMDQTLVNGPNSAYFRDYIARHPEKEHHIVTFRNRSWAEKIPLELESYDFNIKHFSGIHYCPEEIHDSYMIRNSDISIANFLFYRDITKEEFDRNVQLFPYWKGLQSKKIGASVLVDDMPEMVLLGCKEHGIEFLHALDKIPIFVGKL